MTAHAPWPPVRFSDEFDREHPEREHPEIEHPERFGWDVSDLRPARRWSIRKAVLVWFAVATLMWLALIWGGVELWSLI